MIAKALVFVFLISVCVGQESEDRFQKECLEVHNDLRRKHDAEPLKTDPKLVRLAQRHCQYALDHPTNPHAPDLNQKRVGQNYFKSSGSAECKQAVQSWYDEKSTYAKNPGKFSMRTGHFTQLVWQSTTQLGCASCGQKRGGVVVICDYYEAGNMQGQFNDNVKL